MRALLIRRPWIDKILDGEKTWEIRGSRVRIHGPERIALVASGTGTLIGVCDLVDCIGLLTQHQYRRNVKKAGTRPSEAMLGHYRQTFAWVVENARKLKKPVPYQHPRCDHLGEAGFRRGKENSVAASRTANPCSGETWP
jgi:ASCH domain